MYYLLTKIFFILVFCTFFSLDVHASELRLDVSKVDVRIGEEFVVEVLMNTDGLVNAVEGKIVFREDVFEVREIRDGNSSINLWIEKPHSESGAIVFSGITPGGFVGVNKHIFSVVFEVKQEGPAEISIAEAKALENDGTGTEISLALRNATVDIKAGDSSIRRSVIKDTVPPEPFTPIISSDPNIFGGQSFVVFSTQDKDSGISHYEIKEYRFKPFSLFILWRVVESPYILSDQELKSHTLMRALDNARNIQVSDIAPVRPLLWYEYAFYWIILIGVLCGAGYAFSKIWSKKFVTTL
jgi:hypothetical protein